MISAFDDDPRTMRERMLAGDPYLADDPEIAALLHRAAVLAERFAAAFTEDYGKAREHLRELLGGLGEDVFVRPPLHVDYGSNLRIGARSEVNFGLVALDVAAISIGEDCRIGPRVQLLTATHPVEPGPRRAGFEAAKPITLGRNVWLGGGVIVCPGVAIGDNTVVGAGAVVVRDLPANAVAVGNPARVIRELEPEDA